MPWATTFFDVFFQALTAPPLGLHLWLNVGGKMLQYDNPYHGQSMPKLFAFLELASYNLYWKCLITHKQEKYIYI